jgi:transcription-repair coupling factor (superfamily II helicase)
VQEELVDRFGELPAQARCLLDAHRLRLSCAKVGISKVDARQDQIGVQFIPNPPIDPMKIITMIQKNRDYKLAGPDRLSMQKLHLPGWSERVHAVRQFIRQLA